MRELAQQIELLARSERTVALIVGESGVGKGRVARAIHSLSARGGRLSMRSIASMRPVESWISNCSAWSGSVGGPVPGLFEAADGGTLFPRRGRRPAETLQPTLLRASSRDGASLEVT